MRDKLTPRELEELKSAARSRKSATRYGRSSRNIGLGCWTSCDRELSTNDKVRGEWLSALAAADDRDSLVENLIGSVLTSWAGSSGVDPDEILSAIAIKAYLVIGEPIPVRSAEELASNAEAELRL